MQLSELIAQYRMLANDKVVPYFVEDSEVTALLNEAVAEAAIRGRLIFETADPDICQIEVLKGQALYQLHPALYELASTVFHPDDGSRPVSLALVSVGEMDDRMPADWRDRTGKPCHMAQHDKHFRLAPIPDMGGTIHLEGYRVPVAEMEDPDDAPEIGDIHHRHLIQWALHKAFSIPDAEFFDPARSDQALQEFERYFGLRPDSDLRRITREDVPHHVKAFWP